MNLKYFSICWLCCVLLNITDTQAQDNFDIQNLIDCYNELRYEQNHITSKNYFDAFPNSYSIFQQIFGYEDRLDSTYYGYLYNESLCYITSFFSLSNYLDYNDFSNKVIKICLNGEWQSDGVSILLANVINIVTSPDCYYSYSNVSHCYNSTLRDSFLCCLTQYNNDDIASFWSFYLNGAEGFDENLYKRTKNIICNYPNLLKNLTLIALE